MQAKVEVSVRMTNYRKDKSAFSNQLLVRPLQPLAGEAVRYVVNFLYVLSLSLAKKNKKQRDYF